MDKTILTADCNELALTPAFTNQSQSSLSRGAEPSESFRCLVSFYLVSVFVQAADLNLALDFRKSGRERKHMKCTSEPHSEAI